MVQPGNGWEELIEGSGNQIGRGRISTSISVYCQYTERSGRLSSCFGSGKCGAAFQHPHTFYHMHTRLSMSRILDKVSQSRKIALSMNKATRPHYSGCGTL